jgi:hypothetical protein
MDCLRTFPLYAVQRHISNNITNCDASTAISGKWPTLTSVHVRSDLLLAGAV